MNVLSINILQQETRDIRLASEGLPDLKLKENLSFFRFKSKFSIKSEKDFRKITFKYLKNEIELIKCDLNYFEFVKEVNFRKINNKK